MRNQVPQVLNKFNTFTNLRTFFKSQRQSLWDPENLEFSWKEPALRKRIKSLK